MVKMTSVGKLEVATFDLPPANFDPQAEFDSVLVRHGWPRRPDALESPRLRAQWDRYFARHLEYVVPEFKLDPIKRQGICRKAKNGATSSNWSGSVIIAPKGNSFQRIIGRWTVPNPQPSASGGEWTYAGEWIGIDGYISEDVFQAGTETDAFMTPNGAIVRCYLWWEWYPEYQVSITNMRVSPGDEVLCLLESLSPTSGAVYLVNLRSSTMTSFNVMAPGHTKLIGNCAEWIVERPNVNGENSKLVDYGVVYFDGCTAAYAIGSPGSSATQTEMDAGRGYMVTMADDMDTILSFSTAETAELIKLTYGSGYDEAKWIKALYNDMLDRNPESGSIDRWVLQRLAGSSLDNIIDGFLNSKEYCSNVVTGLYKELFGRIPDANGLEDWTALLSAQTALQQIVVGLCDSNEYRNKNPLPDQFVESLYKHLLGRVSDSKGKAGWVSGLNSGQMTSTTVINGFLRSEEYCTKRICELYQRLLKRQPDSIGLADWVRLMTCGVPFQQIQRGMLVSPEYRARATLRY
jgi:hypothetical protein